MGRVWWRSGASRVHGTYGVASCGGVWRNERVAQADRADRLGVLLVETLVLSRSLPAWA